MSRNSAGARALLVAAVLLAGCGDDDVGNPDSRLTLDQAAAPLADAPAELVSLRAEANSIREGGLEALEEQLSELRGTPVVVNFWASWCGPCRYEFPFFQAQAIERGGEVAFLGVLVEDSEDAARTFLEQLPLPYPSYADPEGEIVRAFDAGPGLPSTLFIDRDGEVAFRLHGPVESEAELAELIERQAL